MIDAAQHRQKFTLFNGFVFRIEIAAVSIIAICDFIQISSAVPTRVFSIAYEYSRIQEIKLLHSTQTENVRQIILHKAAINKRQLKLITL